MSQHPTPRGPIGQLIDDAKVASDQEWREIEAGSGIPLATIQSWTSGRIGEPPLRGTMHLARYLGIPAQAVMDRALDGYVPPLRARASAAGNGHGASDSTKSGSAGVASVRDGGGAAKKPRQRTSRPPHPGA